MVSRRKILSRSRDDLNLDSRSTQAVEEEDVWNNKDALFKDHIQEVLNKWESIDDEIWAKIIVLERNRRVAKAYARAPVLTVNGSDDGFDGFRIGLAGFDNPMRDHKTEEVKKHIGMGCKLKMDDCGNILIKRIAKSNVFVRNLSSGKDDSSSNSISSEILRASNVGAIEAEKPLKLFDMKKFQSNVNREMKRSYPDRRRLESQCISVVSFVKNGNELLDTPCWIMLINIVAMDMLKSKMPPVRCDRMVLDIRNRPQIPVPDEDPYSVAGSAGSSGGGSSGNKEKISKDKPPKLPPRENNGIYGSKLDYDHMDERYFRQHLMEAKNKASKKKDKKCDDPYYCGLRARIPEFAKSKSQKDLNHSRFNGGNGGGGVGVSSSNGGQQQPYGPLWQQQTSKLAFNENGYGYVGRRSTAPWISAPITTNGDHELDYSHIYGRLPLPNRGFRQFSVPHKSGLGPRRHTSYVSEWE